MFHDFSSRAGKNVSVLWFAIFSTHTISHWPVLTVLLLRFLCVCLFCKEYSFFIRDNIFTLFIF